MERPKVQRAGEAPGLNGTTRVKVWYTGGEVTNAILNFFEYNGEKVDGFDGVVRSKADDASVELIFSPDVIASQATTIWLKKVNDRFRKMPELKLKLMSKPDDIDAVFAHSSATTVYVDNEA